MILFFNGEYRITQRAAWIVHYCADNYPGLIEPYLAKLVDNLFNDKIHVAVKRNTLRILQYIDIPEKLLGRVAEICFNFLASGVEPVAVKAFSMTVLYNITLKEPELANELKLHIEQLLPFGSAGIKSRGRKILAKL